jgi:hypothetical protein
MKMSSLIVFIIAYLEDEEFYSKTEILVVGVYIWNVFS